MATLKHGTAMVGTVTMMRTSLVALAFGLAFSFVPGLAAGVPPSTDPQNGCLGLAATPANATVPAIVTGTFSYLAPPGGLFCGGVEWGSFAKACQLGTAGATIGAYCGPFVLPGGSATCSWSPVVNTVPTALVIGFEEAPYDGVINRATSGEGPLTKPLPPGAWKVVNTNLLPARVIAYPTNVAGPLFPGGDLNGVICV